MSAIIGKPVSLIRRGPLVAVKLGAPKHLPSTEPPIDTLAEINTSSVNTFIQEGVATSLGLEPIEPIEITTATQPVYESYVYRIRLLFPDGNAVEVNAIEVPYMIRSNVRIKCLIGRDILQLCVLTYNGLANTFSLDFQLGK